MNYSEDLEEKVLYLLDAINNKDFEAARECLHPEFIFDEFLQSTRGADPYLKKINKTDITFSIEKIYSDADTVCAVFTICNFGNHNIKGCGLYGFSNDKIASMKLFTDHIPKPIFSEDGDSH